MQKTSITVLYSVLLILSINSCCKSNSCKCYKEWGQKVEDCTIKHFGPNPLGGAYDYLYFEIGSWWVYRNNLSGETDSVFITSCDTQVMNHTGQSVKWQSVTYTALSFSTRSNKYNADYDYYSYAVYPDQIPFTYVHSKMRSAYHNPGSSGPSKIFHYPFPVTNKPGYFEYFPLLSINGVDYNEVGVFQSDNIDQSIQLPKNLVNQVGYGGTSKYYWAKGFGLVQFQSTVYDYTTQQNYVQKWELIKCNLKH